MRQPLFISFCKGQISVSRCCRTAFWSVIVNLSVLSAGARADDTLHLTVRVAKGSCEFILPQEVDLGAALPADFERNNGTARTVPFEMTLKNCDGPSGGPERAGVVFSGNTPFTGGDIFSDKESTNAGFMFKEGVYSGALSGFKSAGGTVKPGTLSQQGKEGEIPKNGTILHYTVGFVSADNGKRPQGGDTVDATITFQIDYR